METIQLEFDNQQENMRKLFVKNLPLNWSERELSSFFAAHGFNIVEAKPYFPNNKSTKPQKPKYCGYVVLRDPNDVDKAIASLNGQLFSGRQIKLKKFDPNYSETSTPSKQHQLSSHSGSMSVGSEVSTSKIKENEEDSNDHHEYSGDRVYQLHVSFKAQVPGVSWFHQISKLSIPNEIDERIEQNKSISENFLREKFSKFGKITDVIIKKHVMTMR